MIPFLIVISITALVKNKASLVVVPPYTEKTKTKRNERDDTILDVSAKSTISPTLLFFFSTKSIFYSMEAGNLWKAVHIFCINVVCRVVQGAVIEHCQTIKGNTSLGNQFQCCISLKTIWSYCCKLLFCEMYFQLNMGTHKYTFSCGKGNKLYPLFKTNQHRAANGKTL